MIIYKYGVGKQIFILFRALSQNFVEELRENL